MADRAVRAGGVASLEDDEQRSSIFRVHEVLEASEFGCQLPEFLLGLVAIKALGFEVGVDLVETDRSAGLDPKFFNVVHLTPRIDGPWSVIDPF